MIAALGLVADPQYCPHKPDDTCPRCHQTSQERSGCKCRRYQSALTKLVGAVDMLCEEPQLDAIVQLGDIIDGANVAFNSSTEALTPLVRQLSRPNRPVYHVVGNNERRNFSVNQLASGPLQLRCNAAAGGAQCYERQLAPGWTLVVLDSYRLTGLKQRKDDGAKDDSAGSCGHLAEGHQMLRENGLEQALAYDEEQALCPNDLRRRFYEGSGGFGTAQLDWLVLVLNNAQRMNNRVIIASHCPVHPLVANVPAGLAWDYASMLRILRHSRCVALFVAGHDHQGGYTFDQQHHITVPALLEAKPSENRYLMLELYRNRILVRGAGRVEIDPGAKVLRSDTHSRPPNWIAFSATEPHVLPI